MVDNKNEMKQLDRMEGKLNTIGADVNELKTTVGVHEVRIGCMEHSRRTIAKRTWGVVAGVMVAIVAVLLTALISSVKFKGG